jgi:hypothetical protein
MEILMKPTFAFRFVLSLIMSFVVGLTMSVAMTLHNGQPLMAEMIAIQTAIATAIGLIVMLVLPIAQLGDKLAAFYGAERTGLAWGLLQSVVIATAMTFCVSFGMTAFATGFATFPDGTTFIVRWLSPIVSVWGTSYLATILALPLATAIAPQVSTPA